MKEQNDVMISEETASLHPEVQEILAANGLQELPKTLREADLGGREFLSPDYKVISLRGWKVEEEDLLSSRKKNKDGEALNDVLKNVTGEHTIEWLIGARTFAILQTKRLSHGDDYTFKCQCPHCQEEVTWTEDLGSLPVRYLQEPGKTEFNWTFPISEHNISYRLLDGRDERKLTKLFKDNDESKQSTLMLFKTVKIEGIQVKTMKFFKELESADAVAFREETDRTDCGVDMTVKVECDSCFRTFETDLPLGLDFFLPRKAARKQ